MIRPCVGITTTALILLCLAVPAGAGTGKEANEPVLRRLLLPFRRDQDVVLAVSSVEWGQPDRWSFTTRYVHMFARKVERDAQPLLSNLTVTLSPGTAGGRLGVGYLAVYTPNRSKHGSDFALLSEARAVLMRTWGHPLGTCADCTFVGGEVRTSLVGAANIGVGYYRPVSGTKGDRDSFWEYHVGIGI